MRKIDIKKELALVVFFISMLCNAIYAWDDKVTHRDLSKYSADSSILRPCSNAQDRTCDYLKNIGLNNGLLEILEWTGSPTIKKGRVEDWLKEGGQLEDSSGPFQIGYLNGKGRSFNHFHNPLKSWTEAGLEDWIPMPPFHVKGRSSILWAQDGTYQENFYEANWSWQKTREYFLAALTSTTKTDREETFAKTFKGLGHQIHLLQDTAVPDHVRNDAHPEDAIFGKDRRLNSYYFETWAKESTIFIKCLIEDHSALPPDVLSKCQRYNINEGVNIQTYYPNVSFNLSHNNLAPVTQLFDTDTYDGLNASAGRNQGLSEYTNANFYSNDTIFAAERYPASDRHYFQYPKKSSTDLANFIAGTKIPEIYINDDGTEDSTVWIGKIADGENNIAHFVRPGFLTNATYALFGEGDLYYSTFYRDEKCHEDYVTKLIPRAVGYSAGLLNYFFRGDIRLSYEISDTPGYVITNYTGEKMEGDFVIFYDTAADERIPLWAGKGTLEAEVGDKTNTFDFDPRSNVKEPGKYIVVFKGKMGNEDSAVAGYVLTRRLEITPPDQFVYSIVDGSDPDPYFTRIKAKVKNASTIEQMQSGTVQAVAKYKKDTYGADFIYSVSGPEAIDLSRNEPVEVEFNFENDAIPIDATDLYLQVIFKGKIGNEDGAVAIGLKDISEPTPIDISSDTDRICLYGNFYAAGSQEAIHQVDSNQNGIPEWDIYAHGLIDIYFKFSSANAPKHASPTDYNFIISSLNPGDSTRAFYILTDYDFAYSSYQTWTNSDQSDPWDFAQPTTSALYSGMAIKNQTDYVEDAAVCAPLSAPCYFWWYPKFSSYRGREEWWGAGVIFINDAYPPDTKCSCYKGMLRECPK